MAIVQGKGKGGARQKRKCRSKPTTGTATRRFLVAVQLLQLLISNTKATNDNSSNETGCDSQQVVCCSLSVMPIHTPVLVSSPQKLCRATHLMFSRPTTIRTPNLVSQMPTTSASQLPNTPVIPIRQIPKVTSQAMPRHLTANMVRPNPTNEPNGTPRPHIAIGTRASLRNFNSTHPTGQMSSKRPKRKNDCISSRSDHLPSARGISPMQLIVSRKL